MSSTAPPRTCAVLVPLTSGHLPEAIALHEQLLPHGFFVELGPAFMASYYRHFIDSPYAAGIVALVDGRVVGALVGTVQHGRHGQWTTRRMAGLALAGGSAIVRRPELIKRFVRTRLVRYAKMVARRLLRMLGTSRLNGRAHTEERLAVLSHVYIDPAHQGAGLGRNLVEGFLRAAREAGAQRAELVTLCGAEGAGDFYSANGWRPRGQPRSVDGHCFQPYTTYL